MWETVGTPGLWASCARRLGRTPCAGLPRATCRRICFLRAGGPRRVKATAHDEKDDEIAKRREANIARKEAQRQRREQARSGTANGARSSQERDGLQKRAGTSHAREHVG